MNEPRPQPIFRWDQGWLYVLSGLALIIAATIIPAQRDLSALESQLRELQAKEDYCCRRLAAYTSFLDQWEQQPAELVVRLAGAQLNQRPQGERPVLLTSGASSTVTDWIEASVMYEQPAARPMPDSMLNRLTLGRGQLWLLAGGAFAIFVGLVLGPAPSASDVLDDQDEAANEMSMLRLGSEQWQVNDTAVDTVGLSATGAVLPNVGIDQAESIDVTGTDGDVAIAFDDDEACAESIDAGFDRSSAPNVGTDKVTDASAAIADEEVEEIDEEDDDDVDEVDEDEEDDDDEEWEDDDEYEDEDVVDEEHEDDEDIADEDEDEDEEEWEDDDADEDDEDEDDEDLFVEDDEDDEQWEDDDEAEDVDEA